MIKSLKKVKELLSAEKKKRVNLLLFLLVIGMILEMLGMGLILPVLSVMINPTVLSHSPLLKNQLYDISMFSQKQLISAAMILIIIVYVIKSIFFWGLNRLQSKFIFGLSEELSGRLFKGYLHLPYAFHLQVNSAQLLRNVQAEVIQFTYTTQALMNLSTEMLMSIAVSGFLFFVEPVGTLIVFSILTVAAFLMYRVTKKKLLKLGIDRQYHEGECSRHLLQGLNGIKEVKMLGKEERFYGFFSVHSKARGQISAQQYTIQNFPKILLEFFSILGLAILVFSVLFFYKDLDRLVPILGVFAAASFRLLPSINRIVGSAQLLKFTQSAIDTIHGEDLLIKKNMRSAAVSDEGQLAFSNTIQINNLSFSYQGTDKNALSDVSFTIPKGKSIGIIGESGSGKSTLVNIILGLLTPSGGNIKVDDSVVDNTNMRSWQNQIGYVPQFIYLIDDSITNNIAFGNNGSDVDKTALMQSLQTVNMMPFVKEQPNEENTVIGERGENLSGGQRQRLGIARALYTNPSVVILDEATSSLDVETERIVMESIDSLKGERTMLIVAHRLSTLKNCDWIIRMEKGRIVAQGTTSEMIGRP